MPKKYLTQQETDLLYWLENSSDCQVPVTAVDVGRLLGLCTPSHIAHQLAEAESESTHNDNDWRSYR